jgi:protein involved in polysaccharide export with SLBB domain
VNGLTVLPQTRGSMSPVTQMISRIRQAGARVITGLGLLLLVAAASAQDLPSTMGAASAAEGTSGTVTSRSQAGGSAARDTMTPRDTTGGNNDERTGGSGLATVLSANQIISILHRTPEVIVDLKHVMAEFFLKRGIAVQEDSITDEMLFSNIATNAGLRQTISVWLRARGYASDADFESSMEPSTDGEAAETPSVRLEREIGGDSTSGSSQLEANPLDLTAREMQEMRDLRGLPEDSELIPREPSADDMDDRQVKSTSSLRDKDSEAIKSTMAESRRGTSNGVKPTQRPANDTVEVLHQSAPYNLQSLRDLYTQVPEQRTEVKRFGADVFLTRGLGTKEMPIDLPIGPDYVLGPGDGLTISLWGGVSQSFTRVIDREGRLVLPEAGSFVVAGFTLERAQVLIQDALRPQFKDAHVAVSVSRLRTIRVYVVGDVQRPGAYDISSLSTPINALYAAGGPTSVGSLRMVRHMRGNTLIREVDLYDFLLRGVRADVERMEPGDTILVPAAGPQVEVSGMVKRPAIYEFKNGESKSALKLWDVLDEAGGLRVSAALTHIRVERIEADGHRSTLEVGLPQGSTLESAQVQLGTFMVKDGDRVVVAPVLPYSERAIYLEGHVVRPGKMPYHDGMKLSDAIGSYQDLLPEPSDHGEIVRLMPPDLRPEALDFSVTEALAGSEPILLQPFDTIRIRGRYETDAPKVTVRGEVLQPGAYALTQGMTAAQLVRMAGGFKRSALLQNADLASYEIKDGSAVVSRRTTISIGEAVNNHDANADVRLKPGDVLTVHQVSGWNDIGASVTLTGEVMYPGTYGLQEGERLSSVLLRAGGFRTTAYPDGAVLVRKQVKELEEKSRAELIRQIETTSVGGKLGQNVSGGDESGTLQLLVQQQNQVLQRLRSQRAVGRLVIKISSDIATWANTDADIELRSGDVLTIPKRPGFVLVSGQVYSASAITYVPGKDANWYLRRAGGATDLANRKEIFVVRANGVVVGRRSGEWYGDDVLSTRLNPGDVVVVPQKIFGGSVFWKNMLATAQVVSSIAFTAALALHP